MKNIPNFNKDRFKTHVFTTLRNNPTASNLDILDDQIKAYNLDNGDPKSIKYTVKHSIMMNALRKYKERFANGENVFIDKNIITPNHVSNQTRLNVD